MKMVVENCGPKTQINTARDGVVLRTTLTIECPFAYGVASNEQLVLEAMKRFLHEAVDLADAIEIKAAA